MTIDQIISNPWIGFTGTVLGLLGILASAITYYKSRQIQQPAYCKRSIRWLDGSNLPHKDIQLSFRGKNIQRFTITHIAFWNAGNKTIRPSDFAATNPLRLELPDDCEIFDIRIVASTTLDIQARIASPEAISSGEAKAIPIDFEYLDLDDGFSIQIIHDAKSEESIKMLGKIPGVKEFKNNSFSSDSWTQSPLAYRPFSKRSSPMERWVAIPSAIGLGGLGAYFIYKAIFSEFHWYYVPGGLMIFYTLLPFILINELHPPNTLVENTGSNPEA